MRVACRDLRAMADFGDHDVGVEPTEIFNVCSRRVPLVYAEKLQCSGDEKVCASVTIA